MCMNDPVTGKMQDQMLAVGVDRSQFRALDVSRPLAPTRRYLDPFHSFSHQLSQGIAPSRNRMTFRHAALPAP